MNYRQVFIATLLLGLLASTPSFAETFEVKMLNQGQKGSMVFEPDFLHLKPGDKVKFIATHKSHNAATIDGMVPEGAQGFKGKINEELEVSFDHEGYYGIKCSPHYGMGMVMLIKVGDATLPESYRSVAHPARAKPRFDALIDAATKP